jgi:hypothetical protein
MHANTHITSLRGLIYTEILDISVFLFIQTLTYSIRDLGA